MNEKELLYHFPYSIDKENSFRYYEKDKNKFIDCYKKLKEHYSVNRLPQEYHLENELVVYHISWFVGSIKVYKVGYSDDLEVDTSFDLQKRKIFDIDIINIINTSNIFVFLLKTEKSISLDSYFTINLYKLSNPRAPPLS